MPSENGFHAITGNALTDSLQIWSVWITNGQRKVPFENRHQMVPSENGFHVITRECFDRFTSNLVCGSLMDRGRFLSKTGTRWCHLKTFCCLSLRRGTLHTLEFKNSFKNLFLKKYSFYWSHIYCECCFLSNQQFCFINCKVMFVLKYRFVKKLKFDIYETGLPIVLPC